MRPPAQLPSRRKSVRVPVRTFLSALLANDGASATRIAREQLPALGSRAAVFAELIHPAQYEIGELWYQGKIGIADEHRATAIVEGIVEALPPAPDVTGSSRRTCLLAALGPERHLVGLHMLAAAFRDDGWSVRQLENRASPEQLLEAVNRLRPRLVGVSAGYVPEIAELRRAVQLVKSRGVPVIVGGVAFNRRPGLAQSVGADAHAPDARVGLLLARKLIGE